MSAPCCAGKTASSQLARRLSQGTASLLPAALMVFLPKCPLCLAAWLTVATGIRFSAAGAVWLRGGALLVWVAAAVLMTWRRAPA
jgi:hypothetical protein